MEAELRAALEADLLRVRQSLAGWQQKLAEAGAQIERHNGHIERLEMTIAQIKLLGEQSISTARHPTPEIG